MPKKLTHLLAALALMATSAVASAAGPRVAVLEKCVPLESLNKPAEVLILAREPGALECQIALLKAHKGAYFVTPSRQVVQALHEYAPGQLIAVGPAVTPAEVAEWLNSALPEAEDDAWRWSADRRVDTDKVYRRQQGVILAAKRLGWAVF